MAILRTLPLLPFLLSLVSIAGADTLTGTVLDANGLPVMDVDIDAFDELTGDELVLNNDHTDAAGVFTIDLPTGIYTIVMTPPPPPLTTHLRLRVEGVLVTGAADMGIVVLPAGFALSGRVLGPGGIPVTGLDLDVVDLLTGIEINPFGDATDNFGRFLMAVPVTPIELQLEPNPAGSPRLAPDHLLLDLDADTDLGDLQLETGFLVSLTAQRTNGTPIKAADLDAIDLASGEKRFTPTDNTDSAGFVDVVVPQGTYEFNLCTALSERLVTTVVSPVNVQNDLSLGVVQMAAGVILSGRTKAANGGAAIQGVDLDLFVTPGGAPVPTCADNSDANGAYAVVVPNGTYDVVFTPVYASPFGSHQQFAFSINGDTTLDALLPDCDCAARVGAGSAGTGGIVPRLKTIGGCLRVGNPDLRLRLTQGRGGAVAFLSAGLARGPGGGPLGGNFSIGSTGGLLPPTAIVLSGAPGAAGVGEGGVALPLPEDPSLVGLTLRCQAFVLDPAGPGGRAAARRLEGVFCD